LRRPKSAVHDVVEPETFTLYPEMTPKQAKAYKDLKARLYAELENGIYWADGPGAAISRLRQLASAYADVEFEELEDGSIRQIIHLQEPSSKIDAFDEYWKSIGKDSIVVFAEQAQLIELAHARYPDESLKLVGGMSDGARDKAVAAFQAGEFPILFSTTATGGEGISLNRADTLAYLQVPNSRVHKRQCDERIYTEGRPSFIVSFITPGTVDERVPISLAQKDKRFEDLVQDKEILREWLK
jgi:SNF2 family DNA or RNA helicase